MFRVQGLDLGLYCLFSMLCPWSLGTHDLAVSRDEASTSACVCLCKDAIKEA